MNNGVTIEQVESIVQTRQLTHNDLTYANQSKKVTSIAVATYIVGPRDYVLFPSVTTTITLPIASRGRELMITKPFAGGTVTIATSGTDTISGAATSALTVQWSSRTIKAIAGGWLIIAGYL